MPSRARPLGRAAKKTTMSMETATVSEKIRGVLDPVAAIRPDDPHAKPVAAAVIVPIVVNEEAPLRSELLFTLR